MAIASWIVEPQDYLSELKKAEWTETHTDASHQPSADNNANDFECGAKKFVIPRINRPRKADSSGPPIEDIWNTSMKFTARG
jgi:hypothetical protein